MMSNKTGKSRFIVIAVIAIAIIGLVFLWSTFLGESSEHASNPEPTEIIPAELRLIEEQDEIMELVSFSGKISSSSGMTMELLSIQPSGNDAIIEVRWQPKDWRAWKISKASLEIDGQEYNYPGFELVEGLFHYRDGSACFISMNGDTQKKECEPSMIEETPYRVDRATFADVPFDFLQKSVIVKITEVNSIPNESQYCEELNVDTIVKLMQNDFPGIELECFQDPGMNWYRIKEGNSYADDQMAMTRASELVSEALQGRIAGIWKFDLSD